MCRPCRRLGFLQFWRNGSEFGDCRANDVADRIVTKIPVASTTAAQSVVPPTVEDLAAKPASGVAIPNKQAKTTLQSNPQEWRRNMRVPASRSGREPGTGIGSRQAQKWRGRGGIDTGTRRDGGTEGTFGGGHKRTKQWRANRGVQKSWPQKRPAAERAPTPPDAMPRDASRQSSSERGTDAATEWTARRVARCGKSTEPWSTLIKI